MCQLYENTNLPRRQKEQANALTWFGILTFVITCCSLFGVSFDVIEPTEWGLAFDGNVQHLETDKVYDEGRYLIGLGRSFIKFPRTVQSIRFGNTLGSADGGDIICRSEDGMQVAMEVMVQYRLSSRPEDLARLYFDFGENYHSVYARMLITTVQDVASKHEAFSFFGDRELIQREIHTAFQKRLSRVYADVVAVHWVNLEMNAEFTSSIVETQVAQQDVMQAEHERAVVTVQSDAMVKVAQELAAIEIQRANATAASYIARVTAEAEVLKYRMKTQADSLVTIKEELGLTNSSSVLAYKWLTSLAESGVSRMSIAQDFPSSIRSALQQQS